MVSSWSLLIVAITWIVSLFLFSTLSKSVLLRTRSPSGADKLLGIREKDIGE